MTTSTPKSIKATKAAQAKPERLLYAGPTLVGTGLVQNRVFTELPEGTEALCKQIPELRHLLVPLDRFPLVNKQLREGEGVFAIAFREVQKAWAKRTPEGKEA